VVQEGQKKEYVQNEFYSKDRQMGATACKTQTVPYTELNISRN